MATVSATCDRLVDVEVLADLEAPPGHAASLPLRVSSNPTAQPAAGAGGTVTNRPSPLTHRRRSRWFELNPGCFGQAAMAAGAVAGVTAAAVGAVWLLRRARRP